MIGYIPSLGGQQDEFWLNIYVWVPMQIMINKKLQEKCIFIFNYITNLFCNVDLYTYSFAFVFAGFVVINFRYHYLILHSCYIQRND